MNFSKNQMIIIFAAGGIILFFVLVFTGIIPGLKKNGSNGFGSFNTKKTEISFWGVDEQSNIQPIIEAYSKSNPSIDVNYTQFDKSNYEKSLLNALASGKGPDILMFHNTWLANHSDKIISASQEQINLTKIRQLFPKTIEQDCSSENKIYCLPLYIDTLALIYNKDYFDSKGIAVLPKTWKNFQSIIPKLRETDSNGRIIKAAAAIGGSEKSINSANNLLNLIMLQFNSVPPSSIDAFNFYLQFSNPSSLFYTWNDNLRYSLDNFSQGTTAAIFNYASSIKLIKEKNPTINLAISPILQFDENNPVNYADYWALAVSKQSKNSDPAWHFILSATADQSMAEIYLQNSQNPPALRILIQKYLNDPDIGIFAGQTLTAKNWQQKDSSSIKKIISNMIESVLSGKLSPQKAIDEAENEINQL